MTTAQARRNVYDAFHAVREDVQKRGKADNAFLRLLLDFQQATIEAERQRIREQLERIV